MMKSHRAVLVGPLLIAAFVALFAVFDGAIGGQEERQDIETLHLNQGNDALQSLLVHVKHANGKPAAGIPIELISRRWWSPREQWIWPETKGRAISDK